jgi:hypothetical protein
VVLVAEEAAGGFWTLIKGGGGCLRATGCLARLLLGLLGGLPRALRPVPVANTGWQRSVTTTSSPVSFTRAVKYLEAVALAALDHRG